MAELAVETKTETTGRRSRGRRVLVLAIATASLIVGAWKLREHRQYRRAMAEIQREMRAGRHGHAVRKLLMLSAGGPDSDEATYLLGVCEKARGQPQAAFRAWERVSPGSPFGARAIQGCMELLIERGRLADAEALITRAMADPRADGARLGLFLGLVYSLQGRVEDRERVIEACWDRLNASGEGASEVAILLVRLHMQAPSVEETRAFLDRVAPSAPEDDRVWLGKANLAIHDRSYEAAARWLDACLRRRPDDIAVWRTRLEWAMAAGRLDEVRRAMGHLPASASTPAQVPRLAAWLAAQRGDRDAERRALERLVAVAPADLAAIDRLVAIAEKAGDADRVGELRRWRAEVDRLRARYEQLDKRNQTLRDARELAGLAERLGRRFEARVFLTIAIATETENRPLRDQLARLNQDASTTQSPRGTLADLLDPAAR